MAITPAASGLRRNKTLQAGKVPSSRDQMLVATETSPASSAQQFFEIAELRDSVLFQLQTSRLFVLQRVNKAFQNSIQNKKNRLLRRTIFLEPDLSRQAVNPYLYDVYNDFISSTSNAPEFWRVRGLDLNTANTRFELELDQCSMKTLLSEENRFQIIRKTSSFRQTYLTTQPVTTRLSTCVSIGSNVFAHHQITTDAHLTVHAWIELLDRAAGECFEYLRSKTRASYPWYGEGDMAGGDPDLFIASKDIGHGQTATVKTTVYRRSLCGEYAESKALEITWCDQLLDYTREAEVNRRMKYGR
ncbi:hypothetical protein LTR97_012134 [Elasticomyces elasticus]|uniref:Uncharacterized protein n=1 Tax=Elasticomyces elasticus TaxID=574655 RepID=A0AAN7VL19_9PEZI|nr:hypothetical protein LTR97_012134 [Elasticomyces elasticus]